METIEYKNYRIDIEQEDYPQNPRTEWDNLGEMVCFHSRYILEDKNEFNSADEFYEFEKENKSLVLPLFLYDHSGLTINTTGFSCPWDSGQVGIIYVTFEKIRKEYNVKRVSKKLLARVTQLLINEVKTYDDYLTGNVYGYSIDGEDYVAGFYGYNHETSGLLDNAKNDIDYIIEKKSKEKIKVLKELILNKVPLQYRASKLAIE
ncbi:MAG: hypothetical protein PVI43_00805 [Candidatus Bathyarchaeota archaeon]|jgi:hypothetical protein